MGHMSLFDHGSADFRGKLEDAADFLVSLQSETRRRLPDALIQAGTFECAGHLLPRSSTQSEEGVRYLALNIPVEDLGRIARGSHTSEWTDVELGAALLTEIIESTKSLEFGAFKIFADEQEFAFSAVTLGPEGMYREFGRIGDKSFLRFFFQLREHLGDDYAQSANEHFMDRVSKMFHIIETHGLEIATAWAKHLFLNSINLEQESFSSLFLTPKILTDNKFRAMLSDISNITCPQSVFPEDVPLVLDREHFLQLRVPIANAFLMYHLKRELVFSEKSTLGVLEGLRMSIQNELDRIELSEFVSVSLRRASDLSREDTSNSLSEMLKEINPHLGRHLLSFNVDLPGAPGSTELLDARHQVLIGLLRTLEVFRHCLGE
jgi:hypothetical protein